MSTLQVRSIDSVSQLVNVAKRGQQNARLQLRLVLLADPSEIEVSNLGHSLNIVSGFNGWNPGASNTTFLTLT